MSVALGCGSPAPRAPAASPPAETVVFVCEHGAAKSVVAAAEWNRIAASRGLSVRAIARGADPQPEPSAKTVAGLRADGLEPLPPRPQPLRGEDVRGAARIVVFDCPTAAMRPLAAMGACWDDVPAISDGYDAARDAIRAHVTALADPKR